jgi:hypothetical protein
MNSWVSISGVKMCRSCRRGGGKKGGELNEDVAREAACMQVYLNIKH